MDARRHLSRSNAAADTGQGTRIQSLPDAAQAALSPSLNRCASALGRVARRTFAHTYGVPA